MARIIEINGKLVNCNSEVMVQLTLKEDEDLVYIIVGDCGEAKVFGVSVVDVLSHYENDKADDFDPNYIEYYDSLKEASDSKYIKFIVLADSLIKYIGSDE